MEKLRKNKLVYRSAYTMPSTKTPTYIDVYNQVSTRIFALENQRVLGLTGGQPQKQTRPLLSLWMASPPFAEKLQSHLDIFVK